ncbi:MAG: helix-turn-helix transcriptional regulator [Filimonas sp.]|nr:helix-turn-helix transcriptional regulator [Filimonas sp.]
MKKRIEKTISIPEIQKTIELMSPEEKGFVDKSLDIANYIMLLMDRKGLKQKELALIMGKTEAEVSKWLSGLHNYTLRSLIKLEVALENEVICVPNERRNTLKFHVEYNEHKKCYYQEFKGYKPNMGKDDISLEYAKVVDMSIDANQRVIAV